LQGRCNDFVCIFSLFVEENKFFKNMSNIKDGVCTPTVVSVVNSGKATVDLIGII
jgi:hypothetical protein